MPVWGRRSDTKALNLVFNELFDVKLKIRIKLGGKTRRKKPKWFSLLKKKIIENTEERIIKPKKKKWVLSKKGEAFKIREKKDKTIQMYRKDPMGNEHELKELRSLKSPEKELIIQAELNDKEKDDIAAIGAAVVQINEKKEVSLEE
ncbi:4471_t:CDS:2, partial [Gigaspora margarita]